MSIFLKNLDEHKLVIDSLVDLNSLVCEAAECASNVLKQGGKIMFCGNGGSASDSQHLAAELTGRFVRDRRPLAAIALTSDTSALTCISNDYSFDHVFSRQLQGIGRLGDLLVGISTSGNSRNIIESFLSAQKMGIKTVAFLGRDGGLIRDVADIAIIVPSQTTARIQECHIVIGHTFCEMIETNLGLN